VSYGNVLATTISAVFAIEEGERAWNGRSFGNVTVGQSPTATVTISNKCKATLNVTSTPFGG
jgi:hypothetical protein